MDTPTVAALLTVGGLGTIVSILEEIILRAADPASATKDRFAPLLALALGVGIGVVAALSQHVDLVQGALTGVVAGAGAMGIHDVASGTVGGALKS